ncbi:MAG: DUF3786 domain-containing protein [Proteobacteria bacterium]|nr:DUF3786 domain-containing protein [Pseudomonadota bacterium]MBU1582044.1 DUF3786 domain-containing protein [Pseudomonadota bacterium]MBU2454978.1 DUF3786 domain-containing protein [Pseudomonadota bacterium]MBU2626978.1 DUF3786 domain-containing protein [Pseudomonadota bacterium]
MFQGSKIFENHYNDYCGQIAKLDFASITDTLGIEYDEDQMLVHFFNKAYRVSRNGITDASGNRPDYATCVILAKYILLCPDQFYHDTEWVSFKDFKRTSGFTNVNFFTSDTQQVILNHFSGKMDALFKAGEKLGGFQYKGEMPYDLAIQFTALPRLSLLLLYNEKDEEFPAQCTVLFEKHGEFYLDPESLVMTSAVLAKSLVKTDQPV